MRKVREILRQKWRLGRSHREVAESVGLSPGSIGKTLKRAELAGLDWEQVEGLDEAALEERLFGPRMPGLGQRPEPDPTWIHTERKKPGVTLELLHLEYLEQYPDGYRYTQFCECYRRWLKRRGLSMRQVHRAGEKVFVDYSGKKPCIFDRATGEKRPVELFVAVLGASNYTYAEATLTQRGSDFIASHIRAFEYFGGVTTGVVPDQLKSGVSRPCRYEPGVQRTYEEMADYYGTTVLPARPRKAKDKAKVEVGVQVVQRWILARIRNLTFFSLRELNDKIAELLADLNQRPMRNYGGKNRQQLFDEVDRPALRGLPSTRFVYGEWKKARVNIDYHVEYDAHYYSVPHSYVGDEVEIRASSTTVEVFRRGLRIASHIRCHQPGRHTTVAAHMPKAHREHREWSPSRMINWALSIGPGTADLVRKILERRCHPEQGYRSCLGILRLSKRYDAERLEAACAKAVLVGALSYRHVDSILKHGLDRLPSEPAADETPPVTTHENVRGSDYYH